MAVVVGVYAVLALAMSAHVLLSWTRWRLRDGLRAIIVGVGVIGIALLARVVAPGGLDIGVVTNFLALRDRHHFSMTRVVGFGYVVLLYGAEVLAAVGWQRLRSAGRPGDGGA